VDFPARKERKKEGESHSEAVSISYLAPWEKKFSVSPRKKEGNSSQEEKKGKNCGGVLRGRNRKSHVVGWGNPADEGAIGGTRRAGEGVVNHDQKSPRLEGRKKEGLKGRNTLSTRQKGGRRESECRSGTRSLEKGFLSRGQRSLPSCKKGEEFAEEKGNAIGGENLLGGGCFPDQASVCEGEG